MCFSTPPAPQPPKIPDPKDQITAQANATPSYYGPGGSRVYSGNPNRPGRFRVTETLSPEMQSQFDSRNRIASALMGRAERQIPQMNDDPFQAGRFTAPTFMGNGYVPGGGPSNPYANAFTNYNKSGGTSLLQNYSISPNGGLVRRGTPLNMNTPRAPGGPGINYMPPRMGTDPVYQRIYDNGPTTTSLYRGNQAPGDVNVPQGGGYGFNPTHFQRETDFQYQNFNQGPNFVGSRFNRGQDFSGDRFSSERFQKPDDFQYHDFNFDPNNPVSNQYWAAKSKLLNEQNDLSNRKLENKLVNQGLVPGSEAYREAFDEERRRQSANMEQAAANALGMGYQQAMDTYRTNYGKDFDINAMNYDQALRSHQQNYGQGLDESQINYGRDVNENQMAFDRRFLQDQTNYDRSASENDRNFDRRFQTHEQNYNQALTADQLRYGRARDESEINYGRDLTANEMMYGRAREADIENYNRSREAQNTNYQRSLQERQQNYNELAALLGGQQLTPIGSGGQPIDTASAFAAQQAGRNLAYQGQLGQYNADIAGRNSTMSGLFGLGAAGIGLLSDRRLKADIKPLKMINGLMWYTYRYVWDTIKQIGVMADEVLFKYPHAVGIHPSGYLTVNYGELNNG